ncbi:hypothetical protein CH365_19655 [Leptospira neocaledonica]|uniref:Uncharacterized protein n=1 Tax=Leptospira neocaledonica TaxID=2023192 RepID=A0A2M9ZT66_9LEPT|nr:hypothetical protein CH365_19655 [Leptospira neocaledonica]
MGGCSQIQSGEHIVSKGLFEDSISVKGFPWCKDEIKTVGINSLVANILCSEHNSALSKFDASAIKTFEGIRSMSERQNRYKDVLVKARFGNKKHNINGYEFEKWATKTFLNIMHYSKKSDLLYDKEYLLKIVYTNEQFKEPYGLYSFAKKGQKIQSPGHLSFVPITNNYDKETIGTLFEFHGYLFMLQFPSISGKPFIKEIGLPGSLVDWSGAAEMWRPKQLIAREAIKRYKDTIEFHW